MNLLKISNHYDLPKEFQNCFLLAMGRLIFHFEILVSKLDSEEIDSFEVLRDTRSEFTKNSHLDDNNELIVKLNSNLLDFLLKFSCEVRIGKVFNLDFSQRMNQSDGYFVHFLNFDNTSIGHCEYCTNEEELSSLISKMNGYTFSQVNLYYIQFNQP